MINKYWLDQDIAYYYWQYAWSNVRYIKKEKIIVGLVYFDRNLMKHYEENNSNLLSTRDKQTDTDNKNWNVIFVNKLK